MVTKPFYQQLNQAPRSPARAVELPAAQQPGLPMPGARAPPIASMLEALRRAKLSKLLLSPQDLRDLGISLSKSSLYEQIRIGAFPAPVRISAQRSGFVASEVLRWLEERMAERDDAAV